MRTKQFTMAELRAMSDEELLELSKQKNSRGRYSTNANNAMKVRRERSLHWEGINNKPKSFLGTEIEYKGSGRFFTKKFK
jgi:hypothetical protein